MAHPSSAQKLHHWNETSVALKSKPTFLDQAEVVATERHIAVPLLTKNIRENGFFRGGGPTCGHGCGGEEGDSGSVGGDGGDGDPRTTGESPWEAAAAGRCGVATLAWGDDPLPGLLPPPPPPPSPPPAGPASPPAPSLGLPGGLPDLGGSPVAATRAAAVVETRDAPEPLFNVVVRPSKLQAVATRHHGSRLGS